MTMPRSLHFALCLLWAAVLSAAPLHAQRARWEPPGGTLALGQTSQLSLIFEDCEPKGELSLPKVENLAMGRPHRGEQSSFNIVNGQASRTKTVFFTYQVRPSSRDPINIPGFTVQTDKGPVRVAPASFEVGEATVGDSSVPLASAANSRLTVGAGQLWAGEVVPVNYVLSVSNRFPANLGSEPEWNPSPFVVEEWSKPEAGNTMVNGEARSTLSYRTRGYVRQPGSYTVPPVNQLVNLRAPPTGFNLFQGFQAEQYAITSNAPEVVVRPLPSPAPASFNGAVGEFELISKVVPERASAGEPVTWTLELSGTGNWPDIPGLPPREVSRDFRVVQPQAQRVPAEGSLFDSRLVEDVVLIPTRPGTYSLGGFSWSYFDPVTGRYRTLTTEPVEVTVMAAGPPGAPDAAGRPPVATEADGTEPPAVRASPAPAAPARIPRDPLPPAGQAPRPWQLGTLLWTGGGLLGLIPLGWLALAWQRAARSDPGRPAREARAKLRTILENFERESAFERRCTLLQDWQRSTATLWGIDHAVPAPHDFPDPDWARLWEESERVLYGVDGSLPPDWRSRAAGALARRRAPRFRPTALFRGRNLLPLVIVGTLLGAPWPARADAAREAYAGGDFAEAEAQWRRAVAASPTDWAVHHNLALALAQQQQWAEAAAHAIVAFVQNPSNPSVQWHLRYTVERSGYRPSALDGFIDPDAVHQLAWRLSPARWQHVLLLAVALVTLAAILALLRMYRIGNRSALGWTAGMALAAALALAATAAIALPRFGPAADPRAVLIWTPAPLRSIPTDVSSEQQTATLAAGSMAVVDGTFLGWRRLAFPNGQTGWVRKDDFVALWGPP